MTCLHGLPVACANPLKLVKRRQQRCSRYQSGKDWKWQKISGVDQLILSPFAAREYLAAEYMKLMLKKSKADMAFWWGPADKGMWGTDFNFLQEYDPQSYTLADYRTQQGLTESMLGSVTGAELKVIWRSWGKNRELIFEPEINLNSVDDEKSDRLHVPMDMYIKLGQCKKNLGDPKPGPAISAEEIIPQAFSLID